MRTRRASKRAEGPRAAALGALFCAALAVTTAIAPRAPARADIPVLPGAVRADGMVAIVGGTAPGPGVDLVLQSDVVLRARVLLSGRIGGSAAVVPLPPDLLAATLEEMIGEALIAREAERVRVAVPTDEDVRREIARFEGQAGDAHRLRALLRRIGATFEELERAARRRAIVSAFLRANLEGMTAITDAEVERAYVQGDHPFAERPLDEVREELRSLLAQRALERAVRRWVGVLRARNPVTVLARWGRAESP